MTPKEMKFVVATLEQATLNAYEQGYNDAIKGRSLNLKQFSMNAGSRMMLQSALDNFLKNS